MNSAFLKISWVMMMFLLISSHQTTTAASPTGLFFSNELDVGDKFTWIVEQNNKGGKNIDSGIFRIGAEIQIEVVASVESYNHYAFSAENDLYNIFNITIDNLSYDPIFVIDFIIPVVFNYSNGTISNFLEGKLNEAIVEDNSKINTTRSIIDGIYREHTQVHINETGVSFSLDYQFEVATGVLHLLSIDGDVLKLKIVRDYENQVEGKNTSDNLPFNLLFSMLGVSTIMIVIKKKRNNLQ